MSAIQNNQSQPLSESKSAKKKKAKAEAEASARPPSAAAEQEAPAGQTTDATPNGIDSTYESPYLKELYKYVIILYVARCIWPADPLIQLETSATSRRNWYEFYFDL